MHISEQDIEKDVKKAMRGKNIISYNMMGKMMTFTMIVLFLTLVVAVLARLNQVIALTLGIIFLACLAFIFFNYVLPKRL